MRALQYVNVEDAAHSAGVFVGLRLIVDAPFRGGTQLPDVTLVTPASIDPKPTSFIARCARHTDDGAQAPAELAGARQEGLVVPPDAVGGSWLNVRLLSGKFTAAIVVG